MILTITLNSALDRILFIDEFKPGTTMRPQKMVEAVGGKGFDTSVVLQALGSENLALGFVAGRTGQHLVDLLDDYGIDQELTWVEGETRIAHVVVETRYHRHSHLTAAGLAVSEDAFRDLIETYKAHLPPAGWVVAGGSLAAGVPPTAYRQLVELAHQSNTPILIDGAGPPLLEAVAAGPTLLKVNDTEFAQSFDVKAQTLDELITAGKEVRAQKNLAHLMITCGPLGILAFTPEGSYLARAPQQQAVNAAGAGDGVSAALVWRLSQGDAWPQALRWAAATGAAVVLTESTADCRLADVERILPQTEVLAV